MSGGEPARLGGDAVLLPEIRDYDRLRAAFDWNLPARFSIAEAICDRWAIDEPDRVAVLVKRPGEALAPTTYGEIRAASHALAAGLAARGVMRGDRVGVMLPQGAEAIVAHVAISRLGGIAMPLALAFGPDALAHRLTDAGAKAVVTTAAGIERLAGMATPAPALEIVVCVDGADGDALGYEALLAEGGTAPEVELGPEAPALMIYTSGTTGAAKGALHAGRVLIGHLPGFRMTHDFLPRAGDRAWTPADWAWAGGLLNLAMPALHYGVPVVAQPRAKFDPEAAFALLEEGEVRNAFVPPTALRLMAAVAKPRERFRLELRSVVSAGEALGETAFRWAQDELGLIVNEVYGQTECNYVLASAAGVGVSRPGFIGKPTPGHEVALFDPEGRPCAPGEPGEICVRRPDPVMFLGYWNQPEATAAKFRGEWMTTGDQAVADQDGYVRFIGRDDDVITSSGYRVGPTEIEDCLSRHPAVALAAVVGKPDPTRTQIVKAFVQLREGVVGDDALADAIRTFVRDRLSAHEYPREVEFVAELPLTTTGKVIRRLLRERG
ncbi:acyl-coenzyme A synthetases/AMP-(fatty) acid ligases [Methylopila sp. Yamaguchi]|uniref:AMP-binding protein n=1 Tax=Methylopila sp. Yamaguchi TaxID=1437817 RepID=UPI000CC671C5|nr:AMP-binding protein [Methylopila sp. Yamaguchi]GBD47001.1 acyl-coenzyme A synthetases/AMP-(fatty) acid ligases [Methylopila sp. Yamaguchi]